MTFMKVQQKRSERKQMKKHCGVNFPILHNPVVLYAHSLSGIWKVVSYPFVSRNLKTVNQTCGLVTQCRSFSLSKNRNWTKGNQCMST